MLFSFPFACYLPMRSPLGICGRTENGRREVLGHLLGASQESPSGTGFNVDLRDIGSIDTYAQDFC